MFDSFICSLNQSQLSFSNFLLKNQRLQNLAVYIGNKNQCDNDSLRENSQFLEQLSHSI